MHHSLRFFSVPHHLWGAALFTDWSVYPIGSLPATLYTLFICSFKISVIFVKLLWLNFFDFAILFCYSRVKRLRFASWRRLFSLLLLDMLPTLRTSCAISVPHHLWGAAFIHRFGVKRRIKAHLGVSSACLGRGHGQEPGWAAPLALVRRQPAPFFAV